MHAAYLGGALPRCSFPCFLQGRALCGPMPAKTENFRELRAPLVHTNFGGNSYGPIIGPYLFLGKFVWTNGPESSSKVSPYTGMGPWMALPRNRRHIREKRRLRFLACFLLFSFICLFLTYFLIFSVVFYLCRWPKAFWRQIF